MKRLDKELNQFVERERDRFENKDNNKFAMSFGQIIRYYDFLAMIKKRYDRSCRNFHKNMELQKSFFKAGGSSRVLTKEELVLLQKHDQLMTAIGLEVESYYLFAKILLDKVSRFLEHYFGSERGLSLDSHDQLTKNIHVLRTERFMMPTAKDFLQALKRMLLILETIKLHEKCPRTFRVFLY
jgi:hypothetical protein